MKLSYRNQINALAISKIYGKPLDRPDWFKIEASSSGDQSEILIYDVIGWPFNDAGDLVRAVSSMKGSPFLVRINSPGGDLIDALAIYHALKNHDAKVTVRIESLAASSASLISMAASEVQAYESSTFMMHLPWLVTIGNSYMHEESTEILHDFNDSLAGIYAEKSKLGKREIKELLKGSEKRDGTWLTAKKAKEKGFVDTILNGKGAKASFDLSVYGEVPDECFTADSGDITGFDIERILRKEGAPKAFAKAVAASCRAAGLFDRCQADKEEDAKIEELTQKLKSLIDIMGGK